MKTFSIKKYVDHLFSTNDEDYLKEEMVFLIKRIPNCWEYKCEGMTEKEMTNHGFKWSDDWAENEETIPMNKCIDEHIYKILARNGSFGLCKDGGRKFTLARTKFYDTYLFDEYHYDIGGTVKVLEDLGEYKDKMDKSLLNHLMQLEQGKKE